MKGIILDTNILIQLVRTQNAADYLSFINPNEANIYLSIVSVAEIKSIALQNNWGLQKLAKLDHYLHSFTIIEINNAFINLYTEIDAFSQCKNPLFTTYPHLSARNMGKNDLWIAATASFLGLMLVTTDKNFEHLNNTFLSLQLI